MGERILNVVFIVLGSALGAVVAVYTVVLYARVRGGTTNAVHR